MSKVHAAAAVFPPAPPRPRSPDKAAKAKEPARAKGTPKPPGSGKAATPTLNAKRVNGGGAGGKGTDRPTDRGGKGTDRGGVGKGTDRGGYAPGGKITPRSNNAAVERAKQSEEEAQEKLLRLSDKRIELAHAIRKKNREVKPPFLDRVRPNGHGRFDGY